ncbi:MAG TPA: ribonuclease HI [Solirubrobacteraceae bacterium]|jgi:ribonuclease HI
MKPTVELWTDGACSGNPGPGGWAAVLLFGDRERELVGHDPQTTNNRMELQAVVEGLRALKQPCHVLVHTDSAYVRNAVSKKWIDGWQRNGWRTKAKTAVANRGLWEELLEAMREHEIEWVPVKGHAGVELNERCDRLAVEACRGRAA